MMDKEKLKAYWKKNLSVIRNILIIWFVVSYLFGILFYDALNAIKIGGYGLGFWFANQGSEIIFVILIFVYTSIMNKVDRDFDVHED